MRKQILLLGAAALTLVGALSGCSVDNSQNQVPESEQSSDQSTQQAPDEGATQGESEGKDSKKAAVSDLEMLGDNFVQSEVKVDGDSESAWVPQNDRAGGGAIGWHLHGQFKEFEAEVGIPDAVANPPKTVAKLVTDRGEVEMVTLDGTNRKYEFKADVSGADIVKIIFHTEGKPGTGPNFAVWDVELEY